MVAQNNRLYFIDAMRAWAILMMLQGHFIDGLLDPVYRDPANMAFATWKYFRGITAPVFFTVSGFIFTYLLLRAPGQGAENPRIRKGIRRGLQLVLIGYLLRTNIFGLLNGVVYPSFFLVDVLHCIGISLLMIIGVYLLSARRGGWVLPAALLFSGLLIFLFEPVYKAWDFAWLPEGIANYFTRANGSVFTVFPWVGYALLGGFLATGFRKFREDRLLYLKSIALCLGAGALLIWYSSPLFQWLGQASGIGLFGQIVSNNYLFIRLGDVFLVFAAFMILRGLMKQDVFLKIGQNTLSIYVIHFMILYGSFTGIGLYRYLHQSLPPSFAIVGALAFMLCCTWAALAYDRHEAALSQKAVSVAGNLRDRVTSVAPLMLRWAKQRVLQVLSFLNAAQGR